VVPVESDKKGIGIIPNHGFKMEPYDSGSVVSNNQFKKYSRFPFSAGDEFSIIAFGIKPFTVLRIKSRSSNFKNR
jgi:hypothetical protein